MVKEAENTGKSGPGGLGGLPIAVWLLPRSATDGRAAIKDLRVLL